MKRAITSFFLVALFILGVQEVDAQSLDSYSWSTTRHNVASVSWSNAQIASFIDTITDSDISATVGDFKFGDFDADGNLELVVAVDLTGRQFFNSIYIV